jgi:hypothetical protein
MASDTRVRLADARGEEAPEIPIVSKQHLGVYLTGSTGWRIVNLGLIVDRAADGDSSSGQGAEGASAVARGG